MSNYKLLKKNYNLTHKRRIIFLARKKGSISYKDIKRVTKLNRPNNWKELEELVNDKILDRFALNTFKRTDTRIKFRLTKSGQALASKLAACALNCDELKILHFYNRIDKCTDKRIKKNFFEMMNLFKEFGFDENASDLSELVHNFLRQVRKFFSYQNQLNLPIRTLEKTVQNN